MAPDHIKRIERAKLDALLGVSETASCRRQATWAISARGWRRPAATVITASILLSHGTARLPRGRRMPMVGCAAMLRDDCRRPGLRMRFFVAFLSDYADDESMRISAEAIYQYIYVLPRGELKATLIKGYGRSINIAAPARLRKERTRRRGARLKICSRLRSVGLR